MLLCQGKFNLLLHSNDISFVVMDVLLASFGGTTSVEENFSAMDGSNKAIIVFNLCLKVLQ